MAKPYRNLRERIRSDPARAARIEEYERGIRVAIALAELRELFETTQRELGDALGVSQANISRIERQDDLYLSTLQSYVEALGGELHVSARFPDLEIELALPEPAAAN